MKVLIIDDDKDIRSSILIPYWQSQLSEFRYHWLTRWPTLFLEVLEENQDITHISFDHDLGHTDVSSELSRLMYLTPDRFEKEFSKRHIVIHSMNVIGAENIAHKVEYICKSVTILPLFKMKDTLTKP